jgi:hypothetical protein
MRPQVLDSVRPTFRAIATTIVPEASRLDEQQWMTVERLIENVLASRDQSARRQVGAFLRVVQWLPVVRYGRPFTRLPARRRTAFVESLQRSRSLLVRRGTWGIRTLVFLGYYGRPEAGSAIGYRADPRGWDARRDALSPTPTSVSTLQPEAR